MSEAAEQQTQTTEQTPQTPPEAPPQEQPAEQQTQAPPQEQSAGAEVSITPETVNFIQQLMEQAKQQGASQDQAAAEGSEQQAEEQPSIPDHWDKYEATAPVPDEVKRMAHKAGLTQEQFNATLETFGRYSQAQKMAELEQIKQEGQKYIQEKWGDKAEYNLNIARRALQTVDTDGSLKEMLETTGYGSHPVVLQFFANLGKNLQEGGFLRGELKQPAGAKKSPAQLLYPNMPSNQ